MSAVLGLEKEYDWVFISHVPSFYKLNLYNAISKSARILVIFLAGESEQRTQDFVKGEKVFDYIFLNRSLERRPWMRSAIKLVHILHSIQYKKINVGGWDLPEAWVVILFSPRKKNVLTQESSIFESRLGGVKGLLKRLFVTRLGLALVSGLPHIRLMAAVGFKGETVVTGGVGLANRAAMKRPQGKVFSGRFLYVGRLAPEKNLGFLLRVFAKPALAGFHLTLVGDGPDRALLHSLAGQNITFSGHVPNDKIHEVYQQNDVFILPSISEAWGLVVEEALYCGLPVLASSLVGSVEDLVLDTSAGLVFDPHSEDSLQNAIETVASRYEVFEQAVRAIDFNERDARQVQVYIDAVSARGY